MHVLREEPGVTVVRCFGRISLLEMAGVAAAAARARAVGRLAVVDLTRVSHLHYQGAKLLRRVPGVRVAGASAYLRDLLRAGGVHGWVEFHRDVAEAVRAG
jgi:hypothetical protein